MTGCTGGATRGRTCGASCVWGMYAECVDTPDDFDGDGVRYAMDCDDTDPMVVLGTSQPCGGFVCSGSPRRVDVRGTRTCIGPGWSACARPTGCTEPPTCTGFESESRSCPTSGCDDLAAESRSCFGTAWGAWTGCVSGRTRPSSCDPVLATWRFGLGTTCAWTSDLAPNWAADWIGWEKYRAFVKQLVQEISRVERKSDLQLTAFASSAQGIVTVEDFAKADTFLAHGADGHEYQEAEHHQDGDATGLGRVGGVLAGGHGAPHFNVSPKCRGLRTRECTCSL